MSGYRVVSRRSVGDGERRSSCSPRPSRRTAPPQWPRQTPDRHLLRSARPGPGRTRTAPRLRARGPSRRAGGGSRRRQVDSSVHLVRGAATRAGGRPALISPWGTTPGAAYSRSSRDLRVRPAREQRFPVGAWCAKRSRTPPRAVPRASDASHRSRRGDSRRTAEKTPAFGNGWRARPSCHPVPRFLPPPSRPRPPPKMNTTLLPSSPLRSMTSSPRPAASPPGAAPIWAAGLLAMTLSSCVTSNFDFTAWPPGWRRPVERSHGRARGRGWRPRRSDLRPAASHGLPGLRRGGRGYLDGFVEGPGGEPPAVRDLRFQPDPIRRSG